MPNTLLIFTVPTNFNKTTTFRWYYCWYSSPSTFKYSKKKRKNIEANIYHNHVPYTVKVVIIVIFFVWFFFSNRCLKARERNTRILLLELFFLCFLLFLFFCAFAFQVTYVYNSNRCIHDIVSFIEYCSLDIVTDQQIKISENQQINNSRKSGTNHWNHCCWLN